MKQLKILLPMLVTLLFVGCASPRLGITEYTGFIELPFPSNAYESGQIIEIYSKPRKVEITFDPQIPWDQATFSDGWNISTDKIENVKATFATEIKRILKGTADYTSGQKVNVELTNTKTRIIQKLPIFNALDSSIQKEPSLKKLLGLYIDKGTHFDVITQTLSASISFTVVNTSNSELNIDSEVIKKLNSDFKLDFKRDISSNKVISGSDLVVGIHYDTQMIDILLQ